MIFMESINDWYFNCPAEYMIYGGIMDLAFPPKHDLFALRLPRREGCIQLEGLDDWNVSQDHVSQY